MEAVKVSAVVGQASSISTTSWMLAVLSYSSVTGRDVSAFLSVLGESRRLEKSENGCWKR